MFKKEDSINDTINTMLHAHAKSTVVSNVCRYGSSFLPLWEVAVPAMGGA